MYIYKLALQEQHYVLLNVHVPGRLSTCMYNLLNCTLCAFFYLPRLYLLTLSYQDIHVCFQGFKKLIKYVFKLLTYSKQ